MSQIASKVHGRTERRLSRSLMCSSVQNLSNISSGSDQSVVDCRVLGLRAAAPLGDITSLDCGVTGNDKRGDSGRVIDGENEADEAKGIG